MNAAATPVRFIHVFAVALAGALFAAIGVCIGSHYLARPAQPVTSHLSNCHRLAAQPQLIVCTTQLPVMVMYRQPQIKTPAVAAAGVE